MVDPLASAFALANRATHSLVSIAQTSVFSSEVLEK